MRIGPLTDHQVAPILVELYQSLTCSWTWAIDHFTPDPDGRRWWYEQDKYPPGQAESLMRHCAACKRLAPLEADGRCIDCQVTAQETHFEQRVERWAPDIQLQFRIRHWQRTASI